MRYLTLAAVIVAATIALHFSYSNLNLHRFQIITALKVYTYQVEYAVTSEERSRGLMWREFLDEDEGMLFIYDKETSPSFWMRNTFIPLDMIFIGSDLTIKHIERDVPPCSPQAPRCYTYKASEPVQYILEINAGLTEQNDINVGDSVSFVK